MNYIPYHPANGTFQNVTWETPKLTNYSANELKRIPLKPGYANRSALSVFTPAVVKKGTGY